MANQVVDYEVVIRDLERRKAEAVAGFDSAIAALRNIASGQGSRTRTPTLPFNPEAGLQPYRGMTMIEAAIAHIKKAGHAVPNMELAKAIEDGGFNHKSKNFPNTLNSILWRRSKTVEDVRKSSRGWAIVPTADAM